MVGQCWKQLQAVEIVGTLYPAIANELRFSDYDSYVFPVILILNSFIGYSFTKLSWACWLAFVQVNT